MCFYCDRGLVVFKMELKNNLLEQLIMVVSVTAVTKI